VRAPLPLNSTGLFETARVGVGLPASQASQYCCPNAFINRNSAGAQVTGADSACCPDANRYLVTATEDTSRTDLRYCCPIDNRLIEGTNSYCCRLALPTGGGVRWLDGACCPPNAVTTGAVSSLTSLVACCPTDTPRKLV